ncbi:hypothetical protein ACFQ6O_38455 [Streptomyces sp. NPDC056441]|uniref:hypothetical protein n=1 Tax=Streptomyces sp. NPDC056441 TaxID=3345817 RepID=UPI00368EAA65
MVVWPGLPKTTVWLILDGTVHDVRADHLILSGQPRKDPARWWRWTVAQHLEHAQPSQSAEDRTADQLELFPGLKPA